MLRSTALKLYREALRAVRDVPVHAQDAVKAQLRSQFVASAAAAQRDPSQASFLVSDATKTIENLKKLCQLTK